MISFTQFISERFNGIETNSMRNPISPTPEGLTNFWKWFGGSKCIDDDGRPLVIFRGQRKVANPSRFITRQGRATPSFTADPAAASVYARQLDTREYSAGSNVMPVYLAIKNPLDLRDYGEEITLDVVLKFLPEYQDMIDALYGLDDLIERTGAKYEINASSSIYRITSFEELADHLVDLMDGDDWEDDFIDALSECTIDTYLIADSKQFVEALKYVGYDGVIFDDVFDNGAKHYEGDMLYSDGEGGVIIVTYRPFEQTQVKSIFNAGGFNPNSDHINEGV